jgi:hypothetical protein
MMKSPQEKESEKVRQECETTRESEKDRTKKDLRTRIASTFDSKYNSEGKVPDNVLYAIRPKYITTKPASSQNSTVSADKLCAVERKGVQGPNRRTI